MFTTFYINFSDAKGQITLELLVVSGRNLDSLKLSCVSSLPARMRMIDLKMKELECSQDFSHYNSMGDFSRRTRADNSAVLGPIKPNFELVRDVMDVLVTSKYEADPIKNEGARVLKTFSPLKPYGSYPLLWTPEFRSDLAQNLMKAFPYSNNGSDKISLRLANWLRRYSSLKMFIDRQTHTQTTARLVYYKLTFELSAQAS